MTTDKILVDLNHEQRQAVTHDLGPLMIIAGAGTGKTKVITKRIAYLVISNKANPEEILALTFGLHLSFEFCHWDFKYQKEI